MSKDKAKMAFHAVVAFDEHKRALWERLMNASTLEPGDADLFRQAGPLWAPIHGDAKTPLTYKRGIFGGETARFLWANPDQPKPDTMVMIEGPSKNGVPNIEELALIYGPSFKGGVLYQRGCCAAASIVFLSGANQIIRDSKIDMLDNMRGFWAGKTFVADGRRMHDMQHGMEDALGLCASHGHNHRRPKHA